MEAEYHTIDRCQASNIKNKLKKTGYQIFPMTYYDFRTKYPKTSLGSYDLYMSLLQFKRLPRTNIVRRGGMRLPVLTLMTSCAFHTQRLLRKARTELIDAKIIKFTAHKHRLKAGVYKILTTIEKNQPFAMMPHELNKVFHDLVASQAIPRSAMHLYFYLYNAAAKANFPPDVLVSPAAVKDHLFLSNTSFWHLISRLKSLGYINFTPSSTYRYRSDLVVLVPASLSFEPRSNQKTIELADPKVAEDAMKALRKKLGISA